MRFDLDSGEFTAELHREPAIDAPTVVYLPRLHYPDVPDVRVSAGETTYDPATQLLSWTTTADAGAISIRVTAR